MTVVLTIVADDFGMNDAYDRGMLEAAAAGAIDGAGVMIDRSGEHLRELLATGCDVGLHLEEGGGGVLTDADLSHQIEAFERAAGRPPDYLDGHHHCHAGSAAPLVAAAAAERGLPVRSVDPEHRRLLRRAGVRTSDLLVGRYEESEAVLPPELSAPPPGVASIEWMVHPGYRDPAAGSTYDAGREEDLAAVLSFRLPPGMARARRAPEGGSPGAAR